MLAKLARVLGMSDIELVRISVSHWSWKEECNQNKYVNKCLMFDLCHAQLLQVD